MEMRKFIVELHADGRITAVEYEEPQGFVYGSTDAYNHALRDMKTILEAEKTRCQANNKIDNIGQGLAMTLIPKNDRVPVQKLGDPLLVGETYPNAGSQYKVLKVEGYYGVAWVRNIKSGWVCKAHRPALYLMPGGHIELQWAYSTDGHFDKSLA